MNIYMKKLKLYIIKFILNVIFITPFLLQAQIKTNNTNIWLHYVGKNKVSNKVSFTLEATMRYANEFSEKQQYFIRPSLDYQFNNKFTGSVGYSHYKTYVYGSPTMNKTNIPEDHIWIQATYTHSSSNFKFTHRLRDENRFVGIAVQNNDNSYTIDQYNYRNRLRYLFLVTHPIVIAAGKTKLSGFMGDEAFFNIGPNAGKTFFNQNRAMAGFSYQLDGNQQIQLTYIHQNIWNFTNTFQESNPTFRISYLTNLDWHKKKV